MKLIEAVKNMTQLQVTTRIMLTSNLILSAGLVWALIALSMDKDRIVLMPPHLDKKAVVAWNTADKEYKKTFGLFVATLVGNLQPKSSSVIIESASAFMDSRVYSEFRSKISSIVEDPSFRASGATISFDPASIQYESETSRVFVVGHLITSAAGGQKYAKTVTYEIGVAIRNGRPWVTHFLSYDGGQLRTVTWHVNNAQREKSEIPSYALPRKNNDEINILENAIDVDILAREAATISDLSNKHLIDLPRSLKDEIKVQDQVSNEATTHLVAPLEIGDEVFIEPGVVTESSSLEVQSAN